MINVTKLSDKSVSEDLTRELDCKLAELHFGQATVEEDWVVLRDKVHATAFQLLGPTTRKNQDWFDENDEEIKEMLAEGNRLHKIYQLDQSSAAKKTCFTNIRRTVQTRLRKMQDSWLAAKANEIQKYADTHNSKHFYCALKAVYGPQSPSTSPLLNVDGTTLVTDKPAILNRWAEHLVLSSTDQQISTPKLLPTYHKLRQTLISTDHPARKKSRKQSSNYLVEKPQVQMPSLPKYTSMVVTRCYRRW